MVLSHYSIFDKMLEGVQVIDHQWRYVYVNDAVAIHGKTTRDQLLGYTMMEKYPGFEKTAIFDCIRHCMHEGEPDRLLNEFHFPDGSKGWFDLHVKPVEEGVLIMSFDITEQKRLEEELRQLNQDLEKRVAERTQELSESLLREKELSELKSAFVSMASHQLRTPLSTILTSVSLAEQYQLTEQNHKRLHHLNKIKSCVSYLQSILNDFLSLQKLESGKAEYHPSHVNASDYFEEIIEDLQLICKDGQKINYTFSGSGQALFDPHIMRNIVFNLVSNAIKYSPEGNDVELTTEIAGDNLKISIKDHGIGIPENEKANLFQKFYRASNAHHIDGNGLGLNIVKRYLDLAGGNIEFTSQLNQGTTFIVTIPHPWEKNDPS